IFVEQFQGQSVIARNIRRKKSVARLYTGGMQISRYALAEQTRGSGLLSQYPGGSDLPIACVRVEHRGQHRRSFGDEREQPGKANRHYDKKMYSEPAGVNALPRHQLKMVRTTILHRHCCGSWGATCCVQLARRYITHHSAEGREWRLYLLGDQQA